jgi:hypothetical protein
MINLDTIKIKTCNLNEDFESAIKHALDEALDQSADSLVHNLQLIERMLVQYRQSSMPSVVRRIDEKARDYGTYLLAAYAETKDLTRSMEIFILIRYLVRYVLFMDLYNEGAGKQYRWMSDQLLKSVKKINYVEAWTALKTSIEMFSPFWRYEKNLQRRMIKGDRVRLKEIRHHNIMKSRDALIYSTALYNHLPLFTQNISNVIHYNQALQDLEDDFDDIQDDIIDKNPNVFVLTAIANNNNSNNLLSFSNLYNNEYSIKDILIPVNTDIILSWATDYLKWIESSLIPENYYFLVDLGRHYYNRLETKLNSIT